MSDQLQSQAIQFAQHCARASKITSKLLASLLEDASLYATYTPESVNDLVAVHRNLILIKKRLKIFEKCYASILKALLDSKKNSKYNQIKAIEAQLSSSSIHHELLNKNSEELNEMIKILKKYSEKFDNINVFEDLDQSQDVTFAKRDDI
ncbi:MAG: hypothetical protein MHPSP_003183, partial [Paramarteilia canceri]